MNRVKIAKYFKRYIITFFIIAHLLGPTFTNIFVSFVSFSVFDCKVVADRYGFVVVTDCGLNIHRTCVKVLEENCPGPMTKKEKGISKLMERIMPENARRKPSYLNLAHGMSSLTTTLLDKQSKRPMSSYMKNVHLFV